MRTTSSVKDADFPYAEDSTAFVLVISEPALIGGTKDGRGFEHASTFDKKRALVEQAQTIGETGCSLLAVWPGATRSDVFHVDDLDAALEAFA
jgi:hypothetical protein